MIKGILVTCPVCGDEMHVRTLECPACHAQLRGDFTPDPLTRLNDAQRQFVIAFLQAGGSFKEMERILGVSYPTVKARLAEILSAMSLAPTQRSGPSRHEILEMLAQGAIDPEEAAKQLADA